jgi:protein O-GlcNAc transferase
MNTVEPDVLTREALARVEAGDLESAKRLCLKALQLDDRCVDALYMLGMIAAQGRDFKVARQFLEKAAILNPTSSNTLFNFGVVLQELGEHRLAQKIYERAIAITPSDANLHAALGSAFYRASMFENAVTSYERAIALAPQNSDAWFSLGLALSKLGHAARAATCYEQCIKLDRMNANAWFVLGASMHELSNPDKAISCFDECIRLNPRHAEAFYNRAVAQHKLNRLDEAIADYRAAAGLKADYAEAFCNLGIALQARGEKDAARDSLLMAIKLNPQYSEAHYNLGKLYQDERRLNEALERYESAILFRGNHAKALNNRGVILHEMKRLDEAIGSYDTAIAVRPDYAEAHMNRGAVLLDMRRPEMASESFSKALELSPEFECLLGTTLHTKMQICDWTGYTDLLQKLVTQLSQGKLASSPFEVLGLVDDPFLHKVTAAVYAERKFIPGPLGVISSRQNATAKIKIAYYSADFHNHATSYLAAELFESHDKEKFEIYGFSFGPKKDDEMRRRIESSFTQFFTVEDLTDDEIVDLSREIGIDIAVDLKGYTRDSRTDVFAKRAAPIQVNYLGYPGTMAATYFDYIIADEFLIPASMRAHYTENVVYMPYSYQVNDSRRKISDVRYRREEFSLPEHAFVFCCFNNSYKILPDTFGNWMHILRAIPSSVLWLFEDSPVSTFNLRKEAERRGIDGSRLVFAQRLAPELHLARYRLADLMLDTLPYNAHTTASDALWAGLPVLTQVGRSFPARVAGSLLRAVDLGELITETSDQFITKAVELANEPSRLRDIKAKLERNRVGSPLFDGQVFARHLEVAFEEMAYRQRRGEDATDIVVNKLLRSAADKQH